MHTYLYAEVAPVHVVSQEEIFGVGRRAAHFKQFHQVVKLAVDVPANWSHARVDAIQQQQEHTRQQ